MSHDMFGDVVHPSVRVGTKQRYTVPLSVLTHAVALVGLIVAPLLASGTLPTPYSTVDWRSVLPATPVMPPELPRHDDPTPAMPEVALSAGAAPVEAPEGLTREPRARVEPLTGGLVPSQLFFMNTTIIPAQPPPPAPVRVGGDIRRPEKIKHVDPVYPSIAKAARVSGMVIVEATIATDGSVRGARVIRSVPMLDQAALDAVAQWRYTPTLLNGQPVEVVMSVNVTFAIN
jgi:protein TonB